mgnify:CR=1 FL=1
MDLQGDVREEMDKLIGKRSFRIAGTIPTNNRVIFPSSKNQTLFLVGQYVYVQLRVVPSKVFVFHLDFQCQPDVVFRVSFSNLFKELKVFCDDFSPSLPSWSIATPPCILALTSSLLFLWLHVLVCASFFLNKFTILPLSKTPRPPIETPPLLQTSDSNVRIPCGFLSANWATIAIDAKLLLSKYAGREFICLKGVEFCANMSVRNVFTSDNVYSYQVCVSILSLPSSSPPTQYLPFVCSRDPPSC